MRKCPNCKKAIPVGAKRCVHCRTLISEFDEGSSTSLGLGDALRDDPDRANITSFGHPGSGASMRPARGAYGGYDNSPRGQQGRGSYGGYDSSQRLQPARGNYDDTPRHTMLGLGPINVPDRIDASASPNNTMAGLPGLGMSSSRSDSMENDPFIGSGGPKSSSATNASDAFDGLDFGELDNLKGPELTKKAPKNDDDPFAGLPGVAPMPSSLVDEEFVDLTAKLFGDDFAAGGSNIDEEDGWDFDFDPAPEPAPEPAKAPAPLNLSASEAPKAEEKVEAPKAEEKAEAPKAEEKVEAPKAEEKVEPVAAKVEAPKKERGINVPATVIAVGAGILAVAWMAVVPEGQNASTAFLGVSVLALVFDVISGFIARKLSSTVMLAAFAVVGVLLAVVGLSASMNPLAAVSAIKMIVLAAVAANLICAVIYFNQKD